MTEEIREEIEEARPFKPVSERSKFARANNKGQVAKNCINFNFCGKHCRYFKDINDINSKIIETDCIVLKGEFCKRYRGGKEIKNAF